MNDPSISSGSPVVDFEPECEAPDGCVEGEAVGLSDPDKKWVTEEIKKWKTGVSWSAIWGATAVFVAVLIALAVEWKQAIQFQTHTEDRLAAIEGSLRTLTASQNPKRKDSSRRSSHSIRKTSNGLSQR